MRSAKPLSAMICRACFAMPEHSIAMTCAAPALAANMLSTPVPHPTSMTTLPSNCAAFSMIASR